MDSQVLRFRGARFFAALLPLIFGAGTLQATNIITATAASVSCSTSAGPGAAGTITVKPVTALTGTHTIAVTFTAPGAGLLITPASVTLNAANSVAGAAFSVTVANGCVGASSGNTTVQLKANPDSGGAVNDATSVVTDVVTATTSGLVAAPVTITCQYTSGGGGTWVPGLAQTISVTSTATGGTAFAMDTTLSNDPAWLVVNPTTPAGTATASPVSFTVAGASGCGGFTTGTHVATLHLQSTGTSAPDKLVQVSLQIVPPSPLTAVPVLAPSAPVSLSYTKGSGSPGYVDVRVTGTGSPSPFFAVSTATLPIWLTVDSTTGTVPKNLRFSTTSVCDTLAPGLYSATVYLKVSGFADYPVPITLQVTNKAPKLSVTEGTTRNINWTLGTALPTAFVTAISTDSPIPYTVTTGGTLAPVVAASQQAGLAYSFGTQIGVGFNPLIFAAASPGSVLTGTVTLTWGSPAATIVVTFNITVLSPGATLSALSPASLPTAAAGATFTVSLVGSGFIPSTDQTQKTKVGILVGGVGNIVTDTNFAVNVINASNIILTITVPAVADANLPFSQSGSGGTVYIGLCNPVGGTCSAPTASLPLTIGAGPIIQAATSASTFVQVAVPTMAPYDMISLFGANFCSSGGTGCASNTLLSGSPDALTLRYPAALTPDPAVCPQNVTTNCGATQRFLSVAFWTSDGNTNLGIAPLLFATNGQINLMVPAAVAGNSSVLMVVNFGYGTAATTATTANSATLLHSSTFPANIANFDPGVFTVGADGQGPGAILNSSYVSVGPANPAGMRATATDSDTVQLYVTGLGVPGSSADGTATGTFSFPGDCVAAVSGTGNYMGLLNASSGVSPSLTNIDGTVIQSALYGTSEFPPCLTTSPTVKFGGVAGTVTYAGFVPNAVAGLYQINVTMPGTTGSFTSTTGTTITNITQPVQLPVVVSAGSPAQFSQAGVTVWVAPRLKVTGPSSPDSATVGVAYSATITASESSNSPYTFAVTTGLLPAGVTLNTTTGTIAGTPAANTAGSYTVTITATDSANIPVTGTYTYTIVVAGGLYMTYTGTSPINVISGSAHATITAVTATGGTYPYTYAITTPATLPAGMTINASTGVIGSTAVTPAGTYNIIVQATDSAQLTGSASFTIVVGMNLSHGSIVSGSVASPVPIVTMSSSGQTGTITWALTSPPTGVSINASTGVITNDGTASQQAGTVITVTATDSGTATGATGHATATTTVTITIGA